MGSKQQNKFELERIFKHPYKLPHEAFQYVGKRFVLEERFRQRPALNAVIGLPGSDSTSPTATALAAYTIANKDFELFGSNMTTALCTAHAGGGITLTTAGGANTTDAAGICPHLDTGQTSWTSTTWDPAASPTFETTILTGSTIASCTIWAGFKASNANAAATDADQCYFRYQNAVNSGKWQLVQTNDSTLTTTNTASPAIAAATSYRLRLAINAARRPRFWINDIEQFYSGFGSAFPTLQAGAGLIPYVGVIQGANSVAKAITVRGLVCSRLNA